jgi:hypothetical protein
LPRTYCEPRATPCELKNEAIELQTRSGLGKRQCARLFRRSWSCVKGWLNPLAQDRTPPERFVRWLRLRVEANESLTRADRELEAV